MFLVLGFVALFLSYSLWSFKIKSHVDRKKIQAPKPNGAWPILGHLPLLAGKDLPFRVLANMADKYGPVYRIQLGLHHVLVVSSKEAVKQIFTANDINFTNRPKSLALKYMGYNGAFFALAPSGPFWREIRKVCTYEVLSSSRLELLKPTRASELTTCIKELYSLCCQNGTVGSATFDIAKWLQQTIINVMTQMIAGKRYSSIGQDEKETESRRFKKAFEDFFALVGAFEVSNVIPFTEWLDLQGNGRAMRRTAKELDYFMSLWLDDHKGKQCQLKEDRDFIDVMLSLFPDSDNLIHGHKNTDVIKATVMNLIFAGADTTYGTLTWTLALLLNHNEVLKKAQQELDTLIGKERRVEESDIKHLVYLQAIVKETLRLYPTVPLSVPREALEDCTIAGYYVPKGTQLYVNLWKLHRNSETWSNPDEFQPERFLTSHAGYEVRGNEHFEFIPFTSGRRSCPGMTSAMQMIHLTLARLIQGFEMRTPSNEAVSMTEVEGIVMQRKYPLEVVLTPLLPNKLYDQ
ncbi:Cytochrome P450, family 82, subfamily C, polypeptide 4 [Heracleum sosnowskyi]|uniref:Cytochrome P450, family 82, subfamily C, polypeptide 4 n=1 Tax=Heracleum sosnowskyi TaxID=360622 RepID=A0AAD8HQX0_9APIA|nr:Cytochrome P450, family 82, subfamily C, polypeptide 4 [Heracleum sosnowskyi]